MKSMEAKIILNVFEAGNGDFFWLEYMSEESRHHVLIDSGNVGTYRDYKRILSYIKKENEIIEAIVFTHIDGDHIGGGVKALSAMQWDELPVIRKILMNSITNVSTYMQNTVQLSVEQAVKLEHVFSSLGLLDKLVHPVLQGDILELADGARMKIISPDQESLLQFEAIASRKLEDEADSPQLGGRKEVLHFRDISDYMNESDEDDTRVENRASIAFVFEVDHMRMAFLADANPHICAAGLGVFYEAGTSFDLVKLSHHGSSKNTTHELTESMRSRNFLLSTNGHGGKPSKQTLCRLLESYGHINLICNYAWWERQYMGQYFTQKDDEEYIQCGRLKLIDLGEREMEACEGIAIQLRRKNREL